MGGGLESVSNCVLWQIILANKRQTFKQFHRILLTFLALSTLFLWRGGGGCGRAVLDFSKFIFTLRSRINGGGSPKMRLFVRQNERIA